MQYNASAIVVDEGGVGGGVLDQLQLMGLNVYGVNFSSSPDNAGSEKYLNKRAEMWGSARDWIRKGGCLPPDESSAEDKGLSAQLTAPTYTYAGDVKLQLEAKKDIRRRLGISPDDADALAISLAFPWLDDAFLLTPVGGEGTSYTERNPYQKGQHYA